MRNKRFICGLLVYILMLTLAPLDFLSQTVKAATISTQGARPVEYNLISSAIYKDMAVFYTDAGIISATADGTKMIGKMSHINYAYHLGRINDNLYYSTSTYNEDYSIAQQLVKVNITTGENTVTPFTLGENTSNYYQYLDQKGFVWFPVKKYGNDMETSAYYIMRMDSNNVNNKKQVLVPTDISYSGIGGSDNTGNIWLLGGRLNYDLIRVSYDEAQDTLAAKTFDIQNQVPVAGNIVVDKDGKLWCADYSSGSLKQLAVVNDSYVQVVKEVKLPQRYSNVKTDLDKNIWVTTYEFNNKNNVINLAKLEGDQFVTKHIISDTEYANVKYADDKNILITYWKNNGYYYSIFDGIDPNIKKVNHAKDLVEAVKKSLAFVDYNNAYASIMELSGADQALLLSELAPLWDKVYTPDIAKVLNKMKDLINEKDLENFYSLKQIIDTEVTLERNRLYLLGELDSWGRGIVFTPEVVKATDAIMYAWDKKDAASIKAAEEAISKVKASGSVKWLNEQLQQLKDKK